MTKPLLTIITICLAVELTGCAPSGNTDARPSGTSLPAVLSAPQKKIVDRGVRQIIKDDGRAKIISMAGAKAKKPGETNVCGYVSYPTANGKSEEQRYFVRLGPENGEEAALMGQVANSTANSAKVKFMCSQAGLY